MPRFSAQVNIMFKSNAQASLNKTSKGLDKVSKSASKTSKTFEKLGNVSARVLAFGVTSATAAITAGVVAGQAYQDSLADLSALTGLAGEDLAFLSKSALSMSKAYGVAGTEINGATKIIASAKSELLDQPKALAAITEQALLLSKAQRIDLRTATQVLVDSMNQFELGADQSSRAVNVLAAATKVGASSLQASGRAVVLAGTAARTAGVKFEELNAAVQVLARRGETGARAGTALRNIFLVLATSGIDQLNPRVVGLTQALENLSQASDPALLKVFGRESVSQIKILIENRNRVDEWTRAITGTTVAQEQATKNMDTFSEASKRLRETFTAELITRFQQAERPLANLAKRLASIINPTKKSGEQAKTSAGFWFELADGLDATVEAMQNLTKEQEKQSKALNEVDEINEQAKRGVIGYTIALAKALQLGAAEAVSRTGLFDEDGTPTGKSAPVQIDQDEAVPRIRQANPFGPTTKSDINLNLKIDKDGNVRVDSAESSESVALSVDLGLAGGAINGLA
jgi:TP901 family phage tail tape measure protein